MYREYYIDVPKNKIANEHYNYWQHTKDEIYRMVLKEEEFDILDGICLFALLNIKCDLCIGDYEEEYLEHPKIEQGIEVIDKLTEENKENTRAVELMYRVREYFVMANEAKTQVAFIF